MKSDKLQNAIGGIDPDLITRSELPIKKKFGYKITSVIAAMLALAIGMGIFWGNPGYSGNIVYAGDMIAVYPTMVPYVAYRVDPDGHEAWYADQEKRLDYFGEAENMQGFIKATAPELLCGDGENIVYSPLNMYIALAMLAETTDGNTRKQLLNLLDANNIQTLRKRANALWNANYNDDGLTSSIFASSLWLNEKCSFYKETLEILRDSYYASSYQGEMGSESFEKALHAWLNDQTGGLLSDQIDGIKLPPETILALATTVYFQASWEDNFQKESTEKAMFHGVEGDTEAEFMQQRYSGLYYRGEDFSAVSQNLEEGEKMWFILPDEGLSVNDLLQDDEVLSFIGNTNAWSDQRETAIQLAVPKFTVSSKLDLKEPLENLGVTDCFEADRADFSPLIAEKAFVGKIEHGAFVGIDEEGVTAAAYTFILEYGTGISENPLIFTIDRPFIFVITGVDGSVLFIGVVNQV